MDIIEIINEYGIIACFFIILIEYACFPISSEIVLPFSGIIARQINYNFFYLWLLSVLAGIIGSLICYYMGYFGRGVIDFFCKKSRKINEGIKKTEEIFVHHSGISLIFSRIIPITRTYISLICGMYKKKMMPFLLYSVIGIAIWNFLLLGIGYYFYNYFQSMQEMMGMYEIGIVCIVIIGLFFGIIFQNVFKNKKGEQVNDKKPV